MLENKITEYFLSHPEETVVYTVGNHLFAKKNHNEAKVYAHYENCKVITVEKENGDKIILKNKNKK